jgi:erythronate-4-phosphate dehydrogenase
MKKDEPTFLVDADSPYSDLMFSGLGRVEFFGDSNPLQRANVLAIADVLEVRSSTRVDAALLAGCQNLKAVVTPVVGLDHVNMAAVAETGRRLGREIPVVNAAGSTAEAVADWTIGAICTVTGHLPSCVGIIGVGNCGSAVVRRLEMMGVPFLTCDPGRAGQAGFTHTAMEDLSACEVVTFHVPLTVAGQSPWPTADMISVDLCRSLMAAGCHVVVNSSRGGIVDEAVFALPASDRPLLACDVFRGEPCPTPASVAACALATPHIAGSGRYGRANAAQMVRSAVCRILCISDSPIDDRLYNLPDRPALITAPGDLSTAPGFALFTDKLSRLSGTYLSSGFRSEYLAAPPADRMAAFTRFRLAGTRTEPLWDGSGN